MSFTLHTGWHRGTLTSRDGEGPREFATRDLALSSFESERRQQTARGMKVWFATLVHPGGKRETLASPEPYMR